MSGQGALLHALELIQSPHLAAGMRRQELPSDMIIPIRVAGGCDETCWEAVQATQLAPEAIREAARTYLQLVLFADGSDCFRTLGVQSGASQRQMREHMRWLLRWLHPDRNGDEWESVYAERVIEAWREAKSAAPLPMAGQKPVVGNSEESRNSTASPRRLRAPMRWIPVPVEPAGRRYRKAVRIGAVVLMLGIAVSVIPYLNPVAAWLGALDASTPIGR